VFLSVCDLEALTVRSRPSRAVEPWKVGGGGANFVKVQTFDI